MTLVLLVLWDHALLVLISISLRQHRPDGHIYDGHWERGQQHGKGVEGKVGTQIAVVYQHGTRVSPTPTASKEHTDSVGTGPQNSVRVGA